MHLKLENIEKSFAQKYVIKDFSYTFKQGSITCIMGESGIGKTTLVNLILGLMQPDSGNILKDKDIKMSAVFQEFRLCENLTPLSNVAMVAENCQSDKMFKKKSRHELESYVKMELNEILEHDVIHKKVSVLSGGQKQRVAIVRAMCAKSDIVLMDEPFRGLDRDTKMKVVEYIKKRLENRSLILVSHDETDICLFGADVCLLTKA